VCDYWCFEKCNPLIITFLVVFFGNYLRVKENLKKLEFGRVRIFQHFRLVKFIEKFKTHVKNLKIEKIIAFDKLLHELFFAFYFHLSKNLFLTLKIMKLLIGLTFQQNAAVFKVFK